MLKPLRTAKARRLILTWLVLTLALQIAVEYTGAQYDSRGAISVVWWVGQLFALPVIAATELLGSLGLEVGNFAGFMVVTIGIALAALFFTIPHRQGSSSARS